MERIWCYPACVHGWLTEEEARRMGDLARGKRVLELGSFQGRSTISMAQTCQVLHSIDWHHGDAGTANHDIDTGDSLGALWRNLNDWQLRSRVILHVGRIEAVLPELIGPFDVIFIDAAHDEPSVMRDTRMAVGKLAPRGVMVWHDCNLSSVRAAVGSVAWGPVEVAGTLAIWQREQI